MNNRTKEKHLACSHCPARFTTEWEREVHERDDHRTSNTMTDRELYLLTECMEWQRCSHAGCKARREIERLRPMAESWESYEAAQERKAEMRLADEASTSEYDRGFAVGSGDEGRYQRDIARLRALLREWLAGCPAPPEWHWSFDLNIRTVNTLGGSVHETAAPLGRCCYGGFKPKSACASCAAWPVQGDVVKAPTARCPHHDAPLECAVCVGYVDGLPENGKG